MKLHLVPNKIRNEKVAVLLVEGEGVQVVVGGGLDQCFSVGFGPISIKRNP